jgi:hypothetical protein
MRLTTRGQFSLRQTEKKRNETHVDFLNYYNPEDYCFLGCDAVYSGRNLPTIRKNIFHLQGFLTVRQASN